jgi:hypothetical protein
MATFTKSGSTTLYNDYFPTSPSNTGSYEASSEWTYDTASPLTGVRFFNDLVLENKIPKYGVKIKSSTTAGEKSDSSYIKVCSTNGASKNEYLSKNCSTSSGEYTNFTQQEFLQNVEIRKDMVVIINKGTSGRLGTTSQEILSMRDSAIGIDIDRSNNFYSANKNYLFEIPRVFGDSQTPTLKSIPPGLSKELE